MSDWAFGGEPGGDFMSLLTRVQSPAHHQAVSQLSFSPSPTKYPDLSNYSNVSNNMGLIEDEHVFCHRENVDDCVAYLSQEVTSIGMPSLYERDVFDIVRLVNCMYDLLLKHQKDKRIREELENRCHRLQSDFVHLQKTLARYKVSLENSEKEVSQEQEKVRQISNKNKQNINKLKSEREEVKRLQSVIQHRDQQYKHEVKKKEREQHRLKERLHQLLSDKCQDRKVGMEISFSLQSQRSDGKRGTWKTGTKHEEEMYRMMISDYENKQKELLVENTEMRECLHSIQKEMVTLLNTPIENGTMPSPSILDLNDIENDSNDSLLPENLIDGHFQMPFDLVGSGIEKSLKVKCRLLKHYIRKMEKEKGTGENEKKDVEKGEEKHINESVDKQQMERIQKKVEEYRDIIQEQELIIHNLQTQFQQMHQNTGRQSPILDESAIWSEKQELEEQQRLFAQQRANFDSERQNFTEAAIRLGRERKAFEEEKAALMQQQFMNLTPFHTYHKPTSTSHNASSTPHNASSTPHNARSTPHNGHATPNSTNSSGSLRLRPRRQRLLPSPPVFTASPAGALNVQCPAPEHVSLPSTVELYRALGITQRDNFSPAHYTEQHCSPRLKQSHSSEVSPRSPPVFSPRVVGSPGTGTSPRDVTSPRPASPASSILSPRSTSAQSPRARSPSPSNTQIKQTDSQQSQLSLADEAARISEHMEHVKKALLHKHQECQQSPDEGLRWASSLLADDTNQWTSPIINRNDELPRWANGSSANS